MGIFDAFTGKAARDAAAAQVAAQQKGKAEGTAQLDTGLGLAEGSYSNAIAPFTGILDSSGRGSTAYGDATGANGAAGYANAVNNFHTNPGYQFTVDQALDNVQRRAASTGQLASGGTNVDMATQVAGLADKQWQSYVAGLAPYLGQQTTAAQGNASVDVNKANLENTNRTAAGSLAYGADVGIGNAQANGILGSAAAQGGALQSVAKLGASAVGAFI